MNGVFVFTLVVSSMAGIHCEVQTTGKVAQHFCYARTEEPDADTEIAESQSFNPKSVTSQCQRYALQIRKPKTEVEKQANNQKPGNQNCKGTSRTRQDQKPENKGVSYNISQITGLHKIGTDKWINVLTARQTKH